MYERINGKLYKLIDENELISKIDGVYAKIANYTEGIKTCDKSIAAFNEQKAKYVAEIDSLLATEGVDKELLQNVAPEKAKTLGF